MKKINLFLVVIVVAVLLAIFLFFLFGKQKVGVNTSPNSPLPQNSSITSSPQGND